MQTQTATIKTLPKSISFYWRFEAGTSKELCAEAQNPGGGWPLWFEYSSGAWRFLGRDAEAPEWVSTAWQKAKPSLVGWKPKGFLGREGYWVGEDTQKSPSVEVML